MCVSTSKHVKNCLSLKGLCQLKNRTQTEHQAFFWVRPMVPAPRFELGTYWLRISCSTTELRRQANQVALKSPNRRPKYSSTLYKSSCNRTWLSRIEAFRNILQKLKYLFHIILNSSKLIFRNATWVKLAVPRHPQARLIRKGGSLLLLGSTNQFQSFSTTLKHF